MLKSKEAKILYASRSISHALNFNDCPPLREVDLLLLWQNREHCRHKDRTQQICFSAEFQCGNLLAVRQPFPSKDRVFDVRLENDTFSDRASWFYFLLKTKHFIGNVNLRLYGDLPPEFAKSGLVMRINKSEWQRYLPKIKADKASYQFALELNSNSQTEIALCQPYSYSRLAELVKGLGEQFAVKRIWAEGLKLPLLKLELTSAAKQKEPTRVLLFARQSPAETNSSFLLEQVLQLLNQDQKQYDQLALTIFPLVNAEGVFIGNADSDQEGKIPRKAWDGLGCRSVSALKAELQREGLLFSLVLEVAAEIGAGHPALLIHHNRFLFDSLVQIIHQQRIFQNTELKFKSYDEMDSAQHYLRKMHFGRPVINLQLLLPQNTPREQGLCSEARSYLEAMAAEVLTLLRNVDIVKLYTQQSKFKSMKRFTRDFGSQLVRRSVKRSAAFKDNTLPKEPTLHKNKSIKIQPLKQHDYVSLSRSYKATQLHTWRPQSSNKIDSAESREKCERKKRVKKTQKNSQLIEDDEPILALNFEEVWSLPIKTIVQFRSKNPQNKIYQFVKQQIQKQSAKGVKQNVKLKSATQTALKFAAGRPLSCNRQHRGKEKKKQEEESGKRQAVTESILFKQLANRLAGSESSQSAGRLSLRLSSKQKQMQSQNGLDLKK